MVIAKGKEMNALSALDRPVSDGGAPCTWFLPGAEPRTARKRWIAGHLNARGTLVVDAGAAAALSRGSSLLPAGVVAIDGDFQRGDVLVVRAEDGRELARGLSAYAVEDARRIMGRHSQHTAEILGYRGRAEMIHRDDLVLS
jgi:glutamate 5-kinase